MGRSTETAQPQRTSRRTRHLPEKGPAPFPPALPGRAAAGLGYGYLEFSANGVNISALKDEQHDQITWKVFYVVAPDGLCYWFGEKQ